jgi:hypothetical protein
MLLLERARVNLGPGCQEFCSDFLQSGTYCGADNECISCISSARHLELISEFQNVSYHS